MHQKCLTLSDIFDRFYGHIHNRSPIPALALLTFLCHVGGKFDEYEEVGDTFTEDE